MNTGNQIVDAITRLKFEGNTIPNTWYCHIKRETKKKKIYKADILAINILADLIYWYRASEIREEETGKTVGYKKKFKSDKYQKWYAAWAEKFGVTKRQIQASMKILVDFGIVNREVTEITTEQGLKLTGVTYFEPIVEKIKYINIPVSEHHQPIYLQCNPPYEKMYDPIQKNVGGGTKKREHTEIPTKIPTKNTTDTVGAKSGKGKPVTDTPYPTKPSVEGSVFSTVDRRESLILQDFIKNNKNKDFRCVSLCETLLNRAEKMAFPKKLNIGNVNKFKDRLARFQKKNDKGEIPGAIELYEELPSDSYHKQQMKEYVLHEEQKWDFSETKSKEVVLGQFVLEYILWHPVYAHFKAIKEKDLLDHDIANYANRNKKQTKQEQELTELERAWLETA